jgi:hypothetical protein
MTQNGQSFVIGVCQNKDKGYTPSTIKGYRSAIARTIHLSGSPDFGSNEFLSLMFKKICIERPKQRRLVLAWDLISCKFLTYKCCFLLALPTGGRRSELHALSVSESCIRFAADKSSVTLLTDPAFFS